MLVFILSHRSTLSETNPGSRVEFEPIKTFHIIPPSKISLDKSLIKNKNKYNRKKYGGRL